jgi:nuclear pore complex protein Nup93
VEYFYRLRHLKDGKDMNLFFSCISELALESREFEMLLGKIDFDGSRKPGYIDKFAPVKSSDVANEIVESVAREAETRGQFEDALRLYDLAQDHGKVLQLSCHLMGGVVSSPSPPQSDRHRLQTLCTSIAERYRNHGYAPKYEISHTFFLLLDLMTFFDRYHSKAFDEALKIIQQLRLLPLLDEETVDQKITSFKTMDDLVRLCFPDLLLAVMNILYAQYKQSSTTTHPPMIDSGEEIFKSNIRQTAHRLIMFVGMVPYQMPGDVNARLVQLEVLMN